MMSRSIETYTPSLCLICLFLTLFTLFHSMAEEPTEDSLPKTLISPIDGVSMVLIPAGEFLMGTTDGQLETALRLNPSLRPQTFDDERPARWVYLDAYYIDQHEVTVGQYRKFVEATGYPQPDWQAISYFSPTDDHPVIYVSWENAVAYAEWAGKTLTTEAQWEKAARGGLEGKLYPWGDELNGDKANYLGIGGADQWDLTTSPVGSFPPNGYGLYDMAGNVIEWCLDWYQPDYFQSVAAENPAHLTPTNWRVMRGGAWCFDDEGLRCASRFVENPAFQGADREGFRCVMNVTANTVSVQPKSKLSTVWAKIKKGVK